MSRLKAFMVLSALLGVFVVADVRGVPLLPGGGAQSDTTRPPAARPEPVDLRPDWREFFDTQGEQLDENIIAMSQRLDALLKELSGDMAQQARPLIDRIETQMDALADARGQPTPAPPAPKTFKDQYLIPELLSIVGRLQTARNQLEAERNDVARLEKAIKTATQSVDTQLAFYLSLGPDDPQRIIRGLKIIADGLAVAVAEERLRVDRAALAGQETRVGQLAREQEVASERLKPERADLARLEAELWQAKSALEFARDQLMKDQTAALSVPADTAQEKAAAPHRVQQAIRSMVNEAIAQVRLINLQCEYELTSTLLDLSKKGVQTRRDQLAAWRETIAEIQQQAQQWRRDSERERERAGEAIAAAPPDTGDVISLTRVLNQGRLDLAQQSLVSLQRLAIAIDQTKLLIELTNRKLAEREGWLRSSLAQLQTVFKHLWQQTRSWISLSLFKIGDTPVTTLGLVRVALILIVAWLISFWLRRALDRIARRHEGLDQSALYTVGRLSHYSLITIGLIVGFSSIGVDFTNLAVLAGAIGIGIGFGLQSIVNNFVSGLILLFERTLKVGDFVELASGVAGEVKAINVRSTLINTNDNVDIVVPNSEFVNTNVINWTLLEAYRRIHIPFRVAYGSDINRVTKAALEAAEKTPHTLNTRKPGVWLIDFAESSLLFELVVWVTPNAVKRPGAVNAAYKLALERALREYHIQVPFPQRDIHLKSGFETELTAGEIEIPPLQPSGNSDNAS